MLKFEVKNRWSGELQFTAEIEATEDQSLSVKLGLAIKWAVRASADLRSANLRSADLYGANLRSANLRSADLYGANLRSADLGKDQWIIQGPVRSDGYQFSLMRLKNEKYPMVRAGCRWFTLADAKKHWETTRKDTQLGNESLDILIWLERAMNLRGLK